MAIDFGKRMGLGCLRLPLLDPNDQSSIDYETLNKMVDILQARGFNYYDTAYIYHNQLSEEAIGRCLVDRYPRDSFLLSTKMPMKFMTKKEDMERIFEEQLKKCHVDYFDFYLIHSIGKETYENCKKWDTFDFLMKKRAEGKFREFGVSLHDSPEFLDMILTEHPEIDFVVEQLNYIDWTNPAIRSKDLYEITLKHNKPIVVMEGCKGGTLVNIPPEAQKLMKDYNPDASIASWAYRFLLSLPGVRVVSVGMPKMEFLEDNIKTFENFKPLNKDEYDIIDKVVKIINDNTAIPCTYCRYCVSKCPKKIAIPDYFALYNDWNRLRNSAQNEVMTQAFYYLNYLEQGNGPASACIKCRQCEKVCPQHLPIIDYLRDYVVAEIESFNPEAHIQKDKKVEI
jgi:predicted aldo/keto reductase-like oxidoreductase